MQENAARQDSLDRERALGLMRNMLMQRAVDTRGFQLNRQGKIAIAMGSEGHEAVQAGTGLAFERGRDILYPYYRNTGLVLACGFSLDDLFRSQFARKTDRTGGKSIINHITAKDLGIASISSIIAAQCTHAAGAAYALKLRRENGRVVFCQFGEGATSEGEWHEAMNFAAVAHLPLVFVCENNRWAISTPQSKQMANPDVAARAAGYGMTSEIVDGFDPFAVYRAVRTARDRAASGGGPALIEAKCYRFLSHTTDDDDRTYRTREEVEAQRELDPVPRFERRLVEAGLSTEAEIASLRVEVTHTVNATTDRIEAEPAPDARELYDNVYADGHEAWR
ncbi:MAG: thiamine pyrophosphate-dependent dehydrogenase E1 component subunit alpha [Candidatus Eremiobacteraeota bacterium]|nr:thiamine pyrophosphate-dependent dehydrogenase E1 component subunit alpha [Candidatus Eremiobacteraeota bacterium]